MQLVRVVLALGLLLVADARMSANSTQKTLISADSAAGMNESVAVSQKRRKMCNDPCAEDGDNSEDENKEGECMCSDDMEDALADAEQKGMEEPPKKPDPEFFKLLEGVEDWIDYYKEKGRVDPSQMAAEQANMLTENMRMDHARQELEMKSNNMMTRNAVGAQLRDMLYKVNKGKQIQAMMNAQAAKQNMEAARAKQQQGYIERMVKMMKQMQPKTEMEGSTLKEQISALIDQIQDNPIPTGKQHSHDAIEWLRSTLAEMPDDLGEGEGEEKMKSKKDAKKEKAAKKAEKKSEATDADQP
ncbi:hypothetical protein AAMO2058_000885800 [Amorphochlora amoebiformis]